MRIVELAGRMFVSRAGANERGRERVARSLPPIREAKTNQEIFRCEEEESGGGGAVEPPTGGTERATFARSFALVRSRGSRSWIVLPGELS